jgi:hypothetical protein
MRRAARAAAIDGLVEKATKRFFCGGELMSALAEAAINVQAAELRRVAPSAHA